MDLGPSTHGTVFDDPRVQSLVEQSTVIMHVADLCRYGRRWRMTTGFICGNVDQRDTERVNRGCRGKICTCSRTHLPHLSHMCHNPGKVLWSTIANNRPNCLNGALVHALLPHYICLSQFAFLRPAAEYCENLRKFWDSLHGL